MQGRRGLHFGTFALGLIALGTLFSTAFAQAPAVVPAIPTRLVGADASDHPDGAACVSRIAVDVTFGSVCSDLCVLDAHCPSGWGCKVITQGNGEDIGLCFPRRLGSPR